VRTIALWGVRFGRPFLRLQLQIAADGSAEVHGTIHLPNTDRPAVLVAVPGSAGAAFADRDGDGVAGLTRLTARFQAPSRGKGYGFILDTGGVDIDASGVYPVVLQIGETTITTEVRVRLAVDRTKGGVAVQGRAKRGTAGTHTLRRRR
jgi:hypothetical protein